MICCEVPRGAVKIGSLTDLPLSSSSSVGGCKQYNAIHAERLCGRYIASCNLMPCLERRDWPLSAIRSQKVPYDEDRVVRLPHDMFCRVVSSLLEILQPRLISTPHGFLRRQFACRVRLLPESLRRHRLWRERLPFSRQHSLEAAVCRRVYPRRPSACDRPAEDFCRSPFGMFAARIQRDKRLLRSHRGLEDVKIRPRHGSLPCSHTASREIRPPSCEVRQRHSEPMSSCRRPAVASAPNGPSWPLHSRHDAAVTR